MQILEKLVAEKGQVEDPRHPIGFLLGVVGYFGLRIGQQ